LKFEDFGDGQSPLCIGADPVSKTRSFKGAIMALVFFDVIVDEDVLAKTALHGITTPPKIVSSSVQFTVMDDHVLALVKLKQKIMKMIQI